AEGEETATFHPDPTNVNAIANVRITCLFDLNDSILMIGAQRTPIIFMEKRTGRFTYLKGSGPITPSAAIAHPFDSNDWCHYISDIGGGRLAIGFLLSYQQCIVDRSSGAITGAAFHVDPAIDQTIVSAMRVDDRLFGAGWQPRLRVHDLVTKTETTWATPDECTVLMRDNSEHLFAGTSSKGLLRIDLRDGKCEVFRHRRDDPRSLSDDRIRALLRDREGRLWVGTHNGLNLYAPQRWWATSIPMAIARDPDAPGPFPFSMAETPSGELDICTAEGLFRYTTDGSMRHVPISAVTGPLRTTTLLENGRLSILGAEEGLFNWAHESNTASAWPLQLAGPAEGPSHAISKGGLPPLFQIRSLLMDTLRGAPTLVLGVLGYGIALVDLERNNISWYTNIAGDPNTIGSNLTNKVVRDHKGNYWVGTSYGLYQWLLDRNAPANTFRAFLANDKAHPLPANDIIDLLADDRGVLWIATRNGGLAWWDGLTMRYKTMPASAGNTVYGLAMDRAGRLWCAGRGCFAVLDTASATWDQLPLQSAQGIPTVPGCTRSLRDGRIAFIANDALQIFDPAELRSPSTPPLPYLTALELGDSSVMVRLRNGILKLNADEGPLHVEISALDLAPLSPFRYTLELEGVDPAPRFTDENGSLIYASLPAGRYRLLARTVASNGISSAPVELAVIDKAAPVWQRWWFYLLTALFTGAIAYAASRYNYRQKIKLQQVRIRIASDLHDEVGSSLSAITIGSQMAAQLSGDGNSQLKNLMTRIGETSSESLRSMSDIVWAIDPKNDEGEALVKRMRRIAQELLEEKGIDVSFSISGGVEELKLPMNARKELVLIYKEAVHNASKYSGAELVQVSLHRRNGTLFMSVNDNGKGFDISLHPDGHGLGSMQRRARSLGSELRMKSAPGHGTLIAVEVDIKRIRD
ncbi:MAG: two-component regulator propeller domain-containing protein, partial [Flavobacteriales bacterium]